MLKSLFDSSSVPLLEQVVSFTQARHGVLAGNIANLDTPGYRTRDLSPVKFQETLKDALAARRERRSGSPSEAINAHLSARGSRRGSGGRGNELAEVRDSVKSMLYHDGSDVSLEKQVTEIAKNQAQHNMALSLMTHQFQLLQAAITERA
jgi:flagellar basal-body rod protein FlgB